MKIDLSTYKCFWFELEDGTKVDTLPEGYDGYATYWTAFPCQFTEHMDSYVYIPKNRLERLLVKLFPSLQRHWNATRRRSFHRVADFNATFGGMSDVIVAMVNSGDYSLDEAIWICAKSCGRCMNVLAYKYCGASEGYPEHSDKWVECNTVCEFCKDE